MKKAKRIIEPDAVLKSMEALERSHKRRLQTVLESKRHLKGSRAAERLFPHLQTKKRREAEAEVYESQKTKKKKSKKAEELTLEHIKSKLEKAKERRRKRLAPSTKEMEREEFARVLGRYKLLQKI